MSKKELRKELELNLSKHIENVLVGIDETVAKKIRKTTLEASKLVAKKFYKISKQNTDKKSTIPAKQPKKVAPKAGNEKNSTVKKVAKTSSPKKKAVAVKNNK